MWRKATGDKQKETPHFEKNKKIIELGVVKVPTSSPIQVRKRYSHRRWSECRPAPCKLNSSSHLLHSLCCRETDELHEHDSDTAAHPQWWRWQAENTMILACPKGAPRWDPRGGETPMRPNARSEGMYPLFGVSRTNTNSKRLIPIILAGICYPGASPSTTILVRHPLE